MNGVWTVSPSGDGYLVVGCRITSQSGINSLVLMLAGGGEISIFSENSSTSGETDLFYESHIPEQLAEISDVLESYRESVVRRITQSGVKGQIADLRDIPFPKRS